MDINDLIAHSRVRLDHAAARRVIKEKYEAKMLFGHCGGMFQATPEMISFLNLYGDQDIVIKDLYDTPVQVNAQQLCQLMQQRWQEQMNAWLVEYQAVSSTR
jgi:hypothetical protein